MVRKSETMRRIALIRHAPRDTFSRAREEEPERLLLPFHGRRWPAQLVG